MRLLQVVEPGKVSLNAMWLPTWLGMNQKAMAHIERDFGAQIVGRPVSEETLDELNDELLDFIANHFSTVEGLRDYLDGLKFVRV